MKRIISIVLTLCMVFCLAACGSSGNEVVINDAPAPGPAVGRQTYRLASLSIPASVHFPAEADFYKNGSFDSAAYSKAWQEWSEQTDLKHKLADSYKGKLDSYLFLSSEYLKGMDGKNVVCSPVNIYFALAILAECSRGNTQAEILNVLGAKSIEELRKTACALWEQTYYDSGIYKTDLASSVWLNKEVSGVQLQFDKETLGALAQYYYAAAYSGDAADKDFSRAFKGWLDEHTGGLLKDRIESMEDFKDYLVAAIATTVHFKASWQDEFEKTATYEDVFHARSGDSRVSFMRRVDAFMTCKGNGFTAAFIPFNVAGGMWIFLPDEGVSPEQLNINSSLTGAVLCSADGRQCSDSDGKPLYKYDHVQLVLSLPKFDVDAELDLKGMLRNMGIHDVFDPEIADLSGLVSNVQAYVTSASHAARVKIDEEGCEAAAYTVITVDALGWMEQKPLEFKVDRPFAFAITGSDGLPLFTGIVNEP